MNMQKHVPSPARTNLVARGLKLSHLRLVVALARSGQISQAADELGLTQPAASRLAAEISRIVGHQVHRRTGKGIALTPAGIALAERARRALIEIGEAARDLDESAAGTSGEVRIGAVTGPAIEHILPVLRDIRRTTPNVSVAVEVATSDVLGDMLIDGKLDFALSRYPENREPSLFSGTPIGAEPISIIVRAGHPLLRRAPVALEEALRYGWVLPSEGALLRRAVSRTLHAAGLPEPTASVTTSSFLLTLGVVKGTDALAPIARSVAEALIGTAGSFGQISILPVQSPIEVETYMLLTRKGQVMTPASRMVLGLVRRKVGLLP
jgi:DNA-binding transcriptional LysR family regulator